jgi:PAS domain S-box-containing protein
MANPFRSMGFQAKITAGIAAIVFAFGLAVALLVSRVASTALLSQIKDKGAEDAREMAAKAVDPILAGDYLRLKNIVDESRQSSSDVAYAFILDASGRVLAHTFRDGFPAALAGVNEPTAYQPERMALIRDGRETIYDFAAVAEVEGLNLGTARVGYSRSNVNAVIATLMSAIFVTTALAMAAAGALGVFFASTVTRRIEALRRGTRAMLRGEPEASSGLSREVRCWEIMNCGREDCPAHGQAFTRCWLTAGVECGEAHPGPPGQAGQKKCRTCPVQREHHGDEIQALADSFEVLVQATRAREAERDQALAALRESEERWQFALEGSDEGVWDWNVATGEVFFSSKWKALLGYEDHELQNSLREWESRLHPDDAGRALEAVRQHLEGGTARLRIEHRLRCKDGSHKWILSRGMVVSRSPEGKALRMIGTHADVTERIRMQETMVQTEKMLSVGGLAAGMAHEINNPLGGMLQSAQVIGRRLNPGGRANQEAAARAGCSMEAISAYAGDRGILVLLDNIREAGGKAARIVSNMLEFSRKSGDGHENVDVNLLLEKAVELCLSDYDLQKSYDFRKIEIVRRYDPQLGLIPCSPVQIEQVVLNLLRNAAQAMAGLEPGKPRVITLSTRRDPAEAVIEIGDTGPGMDESVRGRVFEPFYTTKGTGVGTGLGLSVSYFIVAQNHGGTIRVRSAPGEGATFTIALPAGQTPS